MSEFRQSRRVFDVALLASLVTAKRTSLNMTLREAAAHIQATTGRDIGYSTLNRAELCKSKDGKAPDVDTLCALVDWLGIPIGSLFGETTTDDHTGGKTTAEVVALVLSRDPSISPETAQAIVHLVEMASSQKIVRGDNQ